MSAQVNTSNKYTVILLVANNLKSDPDFFFFFFLLSIMLSGKEVIIKIYFECREDQHVTLIF